MPQNGVRDQSSDAPKFSVDDKNNKGTGQFGNTVFGVDAVEAGVSKKVAHTGWIRRTRGQGPLLSVAVANGGASYSNSDTFRVTSTAGANATGTIVTNANGAVTTLTIGNVGSLFYGTETVAFVTSTGSGAVATALFTGRAGRVQNETLVACRISTDASDDSIFPDS